MIRITNVRKDPEGKVVRVEALVDNYYDFVFVKDKNGKVKEILSSTLHSKIKRAALLRRVYGVFSQRKSKIIFDQFLGFNSCSESEKIQSVFLF